MCVCAWGCGDEHELFFLSSAPLVYVAYLAAVIFLSHVCFSVQRGSLLPFGRLCVRAISGGRSDE